MEGIYLDDMYLRSDQLTQDKVISWKSCLISHFQKSQAYDIFLPDGVYSTWNPALSTSNSSKRILELAPDDPDKLNLDQNFNSGGRDVTQDLKALLSRRNDQLHQFLQIIKTLSNNVCEEAIENQSTSLESIVQFFMQICNDRIKQPVSSIIELSDMQHAANEDFGAFYAKIRSAVCSRLRKKGDRINCMDNKNIVLLEDEVLSPTFEEVIVLWSLEKISPDLPREVNRVYGTKLKQHMSLRDLREEIFQDIPNLLSQFDHIEEAAKGNVINVKREDNSSAMQESVGNNLEDQTVESYVTTEEMVNKPGDEYNVTATVTSFESIKIVDETGRVISTGADTTGILSEIVGSLTSGNMEEAEGLTDTVTLKEIVNLPSFKSKSCVDVEVDHVCDVCNNTFATRKKLLDHRRVHLPKKLEASKCDVCERTFPSRKSLTDHKRRSHKVEFACPHCSLVLPSEKRLEVHQLSHTEFACQICNKKHSSYKELYYHRKSHEAKTECAECGKSFRKSTSLKMHMEKHHPGHVRDVDNDDLAIGDITYLCEVCKKTFARHSTYSAHMRTHSTAAVADGSELGDLTICEDNIRSISWPTSTPRLKTDREGYIEIAPKTSLTSCDICGKSFGTKFELTQHKDIHLKSSVIICPVCGRSQASKDELQRHLSVHKKDPLATNIITSPQFNNSGTDGVIVIQNGSTMIRVLPSLVPGVTATTALAQPTSPDPQTGAKTVPVRHQCNLCDKQFETHKNLSSHRKLTHSDKFICTECGKVFTEKKFLTFHSKEHTMKNLTCEICGKSFANKTALDLHLRRHQDENDDSGKRPSLRCNTCFRNFNNQDQMKFHVCRHHACELCDLKFIKFKNLKCHKLIHDGHVIFSCDQCEALFQNRRRLSEHKRNTHNAKKKYQCELCPKAFLNSKGLHNHKLVHTGEKPYSCVECGSTFRQKGALVSHFRLHTKESPYDCVGCQQKFRTLGLLKKHRERKMCGFTEKDLFKNVSESSVHV